MSKRTFWMAISLLVGGVVVLPALLVGVVAVVTGVAHGNGQLVGAGAGMAGIALVLGGVLWWALRRARAQASAAPPEAPVAEGSAGAD